VRFVDNLESFLFKKLIKKQTSQISGGFEPTTNNQLITTVRLPTIWDTFSGSQKPFNHHKKKSKTKRNE
jgi:hypothetical protein